MWTLNKKIIYVFYKITGDHLPKTQHFKWGGSIELN